MTTPKELFLKNADLRDRWQAVAKTDWFANVLVYAIGHLTAQSRMTPETLRGAQALADTLGTLADPDDPAPELPTQVLVHNLDSLSRTNTTQV